jgi:hypothetical protein
MAKSMGAVIREVRMRLSEQTEGRWRDDSLRSWSNDACREIARRARWKRASGTIAAVAGTQEYNLASDCLEVHMVRYVATGDTHVHDLQYNDYKDVIAKSQTSFSIASSRPALWYTWGYPGTSTFKLGVFPKPAEAGTFTVHYYASPTDISIEGTADTTAIDVPMGWEDVVVTHVTALALQADGDARWQEMMAKYENDLQNLLDISERYVDQPGTVVMAPDMGHGFGGYGYEFDDWM